LQASDCNAKNQTNSTLHDRCNANLTFLWITHKLVRFPRVTLYLYDVRFIYHWEVYNNFVPRENARCEFAFESSYSLPRKREKLYCVCLVDDASGGTDHINWSASVECTDYARVRKEGILDDSILAAEPHRRIRVCTLLRKLVRDAHACETARARISSLWRLELFNKTMYSYINTEQYKAQ